MRFIHTLSVVFKTHRNEIFFFATIFFLMWILSGYAHALISGLFLIVFSRTTRKFISFRIQEKKNREWMQLFASTLIGVGLFSLVWIGVSLVFQGRIRLIILGAFYLLLIICPCPSCNRRGKEEGEDASAPRYWLIYPLLLLVIIHIPLGRAGISTPDGRVYRAYFSTDYLKHFSVIQAVEQKIPPENPYFKGEILHYYWPLYAFPAAVYSISGDVQQSALCFSVAANFLLIGLLLLLIQEIAGKAQMGFRVFYYMCIPVLFFSLEGLYIIVYELNRGPIALIWSRLTGYNVDGLTRWIWDTPQVDSLLRTLLYMPQAALSIAFFLLYLYYRRSGRNSFFPEVFFLVFSSLANLLIGIAGWIVFAADFTQSVLIHRGAPGFRKRVYRQGTLIFLTALLMGIIFIVLGIIRFGGRSLTLRFNNPADLIPFFGLNFGLLLPIGLYSIWRARRRNFRLGALVLLLFLSLHLRIEGFESDVSMKFSLVISVLLLLYAVEWLETVRHRSNKIYVLFLLLFLLCLPTSVIDIANSCDTDNRRFTYKLPENEYLLLRWAARHLPVDAVVQDLPGVGAWGVSPIPTFMGRRVFVGDEMHGRIFLIPDSFYQKRLQWIESRFLDIEKYQGELKKAGIDYIFWGKAEQDHFGYIPRMKVFKQIQGAFLFKMPEFPANN